MEDLDFGQKGHHWKEHLKSSGMTQISTPYLPSSEELLAFREIVVFIFVFTVCEAV